MNPKQNISNVDSNESPKQDFCFYLKDQVINYHYQTVQQQARPHKQPIQDGVTQKIQQTQNGFQLDFTLNIDGKQTIIKNFLNIHNIMDLLQPKLDEIQQRRTIQQKELEMEEQYKQQQQKLRQCEKKASFSYSNQMDFEEQSSSNDSDETISNSCIRKESMNHSAETLPNSPMMYSLGLPNNDHSKSECPTPLKYAQNYLPPKSPFLAKKSHYFMGNFADSQDMELLKADKKNIVKNVVKGFKGFLSMEDEIVMKLEQCQNGQELQAFRKQFCYYLKKKKFNNQFIIDLFRHKKYSELFKYFLRYESGNWLKNSQVQDKQSHQILLDFYVRCCEDDSNLEKLKVLKCGSKRRGVMSEIW